MFTNQSWVASNLEQYYKNRTGKYTFELSCRPTIDICPGPDTIPYLSGSLVSFLPLQNVTSNYKSIIQSASKVNLRSVLPAGADASILRGYKAQSKLILDLYNSPQATVEEVAWGGGNTVPIAILKPLSRGVITINSTDPTDPPVFDYGTFAHPADMDVAVASLKKVRDFMFSGPMQEVGAAETYPGTNVTTDEQIAASIRQFATSTWAHPACSCAMMPLNMGGVVDSELQVYGVTGLRIVDASIMPMIPGTHTSSPVYAVAEKAADIIKQRWSAPGGYGN